MKKAHTLLLLFLFGIHMPFSALYGIKPPKIDLRIQQFLSEAAQDNSLLVYLQDEETLLAYLQSLGVRIPKSTMQRKSLVQNIELYLDAYITQMQNACEQMNAEIPCEQQFD